MSLFLFVLISLIVYLVMSLLDGRRQHSVDERLKQLVAQRKTLEGFATRDLPGAPVDPNPELEPRASRRSMRERLVGAVERATTGRRMHDQLEDRLKRADWKWKPAEFMVAQALSAGIALLLGLAFLRSVWFLLAPAGWFVPQFLLIRAEKGRLKTFNLQLPDALSMVANALRSGYSFLQALDVVSKEMPAPISKEFGQVLRETRVNIALEDSLSGLVDRVKSPDLDLVVTAVLIQRQVGGNLSEVLDKISGTIRERIRLHGEIRALTAQGRMSGWVVSLLPIALAIIMQTISPGYLSPLFSSPIGWTMVGAGVVMQGIGITFIKNMVNMGV